MTTRKTSWLSYPFVTGLPVYQYTLRLLMDKFARQLLESNKIIYEIALECVFSDTKNLARQLKDVTGYTPNEFRKIQSVVA